MHFVKVLIQKWKKFSLLPPLFCPSVCFRCFCHFQPFSSSGIRHFTSYFCFVITNLEILRESKSEKYRQGLMENLVWLWSWRRSQYYKQHNTVKISLIELYFIVTTIFMWNVENTEEKTRPSTQFAMTLLDLLANLRLDGWI